MHLVFRTAACALLLVGARFSTVAAQHVDYIPLPASATPSVYTNFTVEIGIYNGGPTNSTSSLIVTNYLPDGWSLISASVASHRMSTTATHTIYWTGPPPEDGVPLILDGGRAVAFRPHPIPAGSWRPVYIEARAERVGLYTNIVEIDAGAGAVDLQPGNNRRVQVIEVLPPRLSVMGGVSSQEINEGLSEFTVWLSSSNSVPVAVDYHTMNGLAHAGEDFEETSGRLVFPPGVVEGKVYVPIMDDLLEEETNQSFSLQLTNAVNARIGAASAENWIVDEEVPLVLSVTNVVQAEEGKPGLFKISLSGAADIPVSVDFSMTSPRSVSGTATIAAGQLEGFFEVPISCDFADDPERTYSLNLSNQRGTPEITLAQNQVSGVIGADLAPGKFHHLEVLPIPSPQLEGRPFPVTVMLKDYLGGPATNYFTPPVLASFAYWGHVFANVHYLPLTNFSDGALIVSLTFPNASTNISVLAYNYCLGALQNSTSSSFKVIPPPSLFVSLPPSGTEGDGGFALAGRVSITNVDSQDVVVELSSSDTNQVTASLSVIIPAGQTSAVFQVTVEDDSLLNGTRSVNVSARSSGYNEGLATMLVHDDEAATLTVSIEPNYLEGSGAFTGTVTASRPVDWNTSITLSSSDSSELFFSCCSVMLAGSVSATFWFHVPNDNLFDGPQPVIVTARVQNWMEGSTSTVIQDNDTNIVVGFGGSNKPPGEGAGTITNSLQVTLPGNTVEPVTVELSSSDISEVIVPPSVLIPAGQRSAYVHATYPDDNEFDGRQTVTITATVPGVPPATMTLSVPDNDVHHFIFGSIPGQQTSGVPFRVSLTAKDVNNVTMTSFPEVVSLQARLGTSFLAVRPSALSNFLRGIWSGNIALDGWGTNLQLVATAPNGTFTQSNPFSIPPPAWAADLRIQQAVLDAQGVTVLFNTVTGKLYQIEMVPRLDTSPWQPVGAAVLGTGGPRSFLDTNPPPAGQRFYRLSVSE